MKTLVTGVGGRLGPDIMNELHKQGDEGSENDICGIAEGPTVTAELCPQESSPTENYESLLKQYACLAEQNEALAKEYLKLEQEHAAIVVAHEREQELERQLAETQAVLSGVLGSLSWRVTAPLRSVMEWLRRH